MPITMSQRTATLIASLVAVTSVAVTSVSATAVAGDITEPATVKLKDGVKLIPLVDLQLGHDSNIFSTPTERQSSFISVASPRLKLVADTESGSHTAEYTLNNGHYSASQQDNFTDHQLLLASRVTGADAHRFDLGYDFLASHQRRGHGITEGNANGVATPIRYHTHQFDTAYRYGSDNAPMGLEMALQYTDKQYTNHRNLTRSRDYTTTALQTAILTSPGGRTATLLELSAEQINYTSSPLNRPGRDSRLYNALLGVRWQGSAVTTGTLKIGYLKKNFSDRRRQHFSGLAWDLGLIWQPLTYSTFNLNTARRAQDPDLAGDYIDNKQLGLEWHHQWRHNVASRLGITHDNMDYVGIDRHDKLSRLSLRLHVNVRRWLNIVMGYEVTEKTSTRDDLNFNRHALYIGTQISL